MTLPRGYPVEKIIRRFHEPCPECGIRTVVGKQGEHQRECMSCGYIIRTEAPLPAINPERVNWDEYKEVVYYLRFGNRVKIGTSRNLRERLLQIPHDEVMATEPGTYDLESRRHRQFRRIRIPGQREWFTLTPELQAHIESLRA